MLKLLSLAFLHASTFQSPASYPHIEQQLGTTYRSTDVQLMWGIAPSSFKWARYNENGPLVAVVIAESHTELFLYLEPCDICAELVKANKETGTIASIRQAHELTCSGVKQDLKASGVESTICEP